MTEIERAKKTHEKHTPNLKSEDLREDSLTFRFCSFFEVFCTVLSHTNKAT